MIIVNIDDGIDVAGPGKSTVVLHEKVELPEAPAPSQPVTLNPLKCLLCTFTSCRKNKKLCCSPTCTKRICRKCSST